jgi:hypothetical protein
VSHHPAQPDQPELRRRWRLLSPRGRRAILDWRDAERAAAAEHSAAIRRILEQPGPDPAAGVLGPVHRVA